MDWQIVHALNRVLTHHDGLEDTVVTYERLSEVLFLGLLVGLFFFASDRVRRGVVGAFAASAVALVAAQIISRLVNRPRPFVDHASVHQFVAHAADAGFPSDHATAAFAIAVALLLRSRRWGLIALSLAAVLIVGRVAIGVHYPTDVLAGAALGTLIAIVLGTGPAGRASDRLADRLPPAGFVMRGRAPVRPLR